MALGKGAVKSDKTTEECNDDGNLPKAISLDKGMGTGIYLQYQRRFTVSGGMVALYLLEAIAMMLGGLGTPDSMKPLMMHEQGTPDEREQKKTRYT